MNFFTRFLSDFPKNPKDRCTQQRYVALRIKNCRYLRLRTCTSSQLHDDKVDICNHNQCGQKQFKVLKLILICLSSLLILQWFLLCSLRLYEHDNKLIISLSMCLSISFCHFRRETLEARKGDHEGVLRSSRQRTSDTSNEDAVVGKRAT